MKKMIWFAMIVLGCSFTLLLLTPAPAGAENLCFPAMGKFESMILPPDQCAGTLCTRGRLFGSLGGDYEYTGAAMIPPQEPTIPSVMFYTGFSKVYTLRGRLDLTDAGALDMVTGTLSALLIVTGGTDDYGNAKGYLHVYGAADMASGVAKGSFEGMICR